MNLERVVPWVPHVPLVPRVRFSFLFWFLFIVVAGCQSPAGPFRTMVLRVNGAVVSSANTNLLAGAEVTLSSGGNFNLPATLATAQTTAAGTYSIQTALSYRGTCPAIWLTAAAPGYVTSSPQDSRHSVACNGDPQNITITLNPN